MRRRDFLRAAAGAGAVAGLATACGGGNSAGGGSGSSAKTLTVSFQQFGASRVQTNFLVGVKKQFEAANQGVTVKLQPIVASENDYYTKLQLSMRSPRTSPDVVYEDTFLINSDISAGYLTALDDHLKDWPDWASFKPTAKSAAQALDGKTYGIPDGTDVRAIWFNKDLFAKAGLPAKWQPKTWDDILSAARTIKAKLPGIVPLNVYAGTGVGEAASMQGFEMLLYGTPNGTLFDKASQKWVVGSQGFSDAMGFVHTVYSSGLGPTPQQALAPTWANTVAQEYLPKGKLAIAVDGSWLSGNWLRSGPSPWPQWSKVMGQAWMPTQQGQGAGKISLSGGWTWAIPKNAQNPGPAWDLIAMLTSKQNELAYDIAGVQIPVRSDVAADKSFIAANPTNAFFSDLVASTVYRPAYSDYPKVSLLIQQATEKVMTGSTSPEAAVAFFGQGVEQAVTSAKVTKA